MEYMESEMETGYYIGFESLGPWKGIFCHIMMCVDRPQRGRGRERERERRLRALVFLVL